MPLPDHSSQSESKELAAWQWALSAAGQQALTELIERQPFTPRDIQHARKQYGEERARTLIEIAPQHWPVAEKLGIVGCVATNRGLQQATDHWIARYKANRVPVGAKVYDICCGIGGDAMALAARGPLIGVDRDPVMCFIAAHNTSLTRANDAEFRCADAEGLSLEDQAWLHIDPDRRSDLGRASTPDRCSPDTHVIDALLENCAGAMVKLSPAADIPDRWRKTASQREWISRSGSCRQQVLWFGEGAAEIKLRMGSAFCQVSATQVHVSGTCCTLSCSEEERTQTLVQSVEEPDHWIFDWDPAVRAAALSDVLGARLSSNSIGGPTGFYTAPQRPQNNPWEPLYSAFQVLWSGPLDIKQLRRVIQTFPVSSLEIKVRGLDLTPESLRQQLLPGTRKDHRPPAPAHPLTVLVGRSQRGKSSRGGYSAFAAIAQRRKGTEAEESV